MITTLSLFRLSSQDYHTNEVVQEMTSGYDSISDTDDNQETSNNDYKCDILPIHQVCGYIICHLNLIFIIESTLSNY